MDLTGNMWMRIFSRPLQTALSSLCSLCSDVTILVLSSRFNFDSICYKEFDVNSISIFRQEISYTSPINLGAAMLHYSGKAGEVVMLRLWVFHLDSISIRFFTKNSMSIRFRFFRQEISYTSPINLGAAMLNYSGEAGEAGNDSERSTTVAHLYTRVHM